MCLKKNPLFFKTFNYFSLKKNSMSILLNCSFLLEILFLSFLAFKRTTTERLGPDDRKVSAKIWPYNKTGDNTAGRSEARNKVL